MGKGRSSNDDRSDRYNPNNDAYWAAESNEASQCGDDDEAAAGGPPSSPPQAIDSSKVALDWPGLNSHGSSGCRIPWGDREPRGGARPIEERCGARLLDRTSRWLSLMRLLLRPALDMEVQSAKSRNKQRAQLAIRAEIAELARRMAALHSRGRTLSDDMRAAVRQLLSLRAHTDEDAPDIQTETQEVMGAWETCNLDRPLSSLTWEDISEGESQLRSSREDQWGNRPTVDVCFVDVPGLLVKAHDPDRYYPDLTTLSWHELLDRISSLLCQLAGELPPGAVLVSFEANTHSTESPHHSIDSTEDDRHTPWFAQVREGEFGDLAELAVPKRGAHGVWDKEVNHVFIVPPPADTSQERDAIIEVIEAARNFLAPLPESVDPVGLLDAMIGAAMRAEWAQAASCVVGLRFDPLGEPRFASPCALDRRDAVRLGRALARRGYRCTRLPVGKIGALARWETGEADIELASSDESFVLNMPDLDQHR